MLLVLLVSLMFVVLLLECDALLSRSDFVSQYEPLVCFAGDTSAFCD